MSVSDIGEILMVIVCKGPRTSPFWSQTDRLQLAGLRQTSHAGRRPRFVVHLAGDRWSFLMAAVRNFCGVRRSTSVALLCSYVPFCR